MTKNVQAVISITVFVYAARPRQIHDRQWQNMINIPRHQKQ